MTNPTAKKPFTSRMKCRPTAAFGWWLVAAIALLAVGWIKNINLVLLLSYLLVVLVGVNAYTAWQMVRRVVVTRQGLSPVFARENVTMKLEVSNSSAAKSVVSIRDTINEQNRVWFIPSLAAGAMVPITSSIAFVRGRHTGRAVQAESGYPFGLLNWKREVCAPAEVIVLPAVGMVDLPHLRRWLLRQGPGEGNVSRPMPRHASVDGDVRGLRPYRHGDGPRDVHWRSSARRGELLVREYGQTAPLDLMIILDHWLPLIDDPEFVNGAAEARLEWALSLAVSVAWAWAHADLPGGLTLVIPGRRPVVASGSCSPGFVRQAFAPLADLAGTTDMPTLPAVATQPRQRTLRLLVSTRTGGSVTESLRQAGVPFAISDPTQRPVWYTPPVGLDLPV